MAKETGKLQAVALKHLPTAKHFDGGGLYLHVQKTGARAWRMKYRFAGKEKLLAFGMYPEVSLAEARQRRTEARALLREGIDPSWHKHNQKENVKRAAKTMFPQVAKDWLEACRPTWSKETYRKASYVVEAYLEPKLRKESIDTLSTPTAAHVLVSIHEQAPSLASKARQYLGQMIEYAIRYGLRDEGRRLNLRGALPKTGKGHFPAATLPNEVQRLVEAIAAYESPVTRAALQFVMLTVQRPENIVEAEWNEIDLKEAEWRIPDTKMKTGHSHIVPLQRQAISILKNMQQYTEGQQYIFPPLATQKNPHLHRDTLSKALREMGFQGKHTTHGFRAMFRTVGRERLGIAPDVLEAQLAHAKKDEVQKAYDRTRFLQERKTAMQQWADYLDSLKDGTKATHAKG
ncbi:integrase [Lysobacteraceae bacterium NML03-0222]|nr:integrase [Xanthomonadaceae bacterium NML03-0222]